MGAKRIVQDNTDANSVAHLIMPRSTPILRNLQFSLMGYESA